MVNQEQISAKFSELSAGKLLCTEALELVVTGHIAQARELVANLNAEKRKKIRREYLLVAEEIELAWRINGGQYQEPVRSIFLILSELERSRFRTQIAWLYSAVGFALGLLGDAERGLEWTQRALTQSELGS